MRSKKSEIGAVFIYAISAIVIILVLYFGYKGVTGLQKANEQGIMEKLQLRMKADLNNLAIHYGAVAQLKYDVPSDFTKICFVDLNLNSTEKDKRDFFLNSPEYALIYDSVNQENNVKNVFFMGAKFVSIDEGKMQISCSPYVFCVDPSRGKFNITAEGGGDTVIIRNC